MLPKSRNLRLAKLLIAPSILLMLVLALATGLVLVQADAHDRPAEIFVEPFSSSHDPVELGSGGTRAFAVVVLPNDRDVDVVSLVIGFDSHFLEVVDADGNPTDEIERHPESPVVQSNTENQVDNETGMILYTDGYMDPVSHVFPVAIIRFRAKGPTTQGDLSELVFLVDGNTQTSVVGEVGTQLLHNTEDFTGAWINISERTVELVMVPETTRDQPAVIDGEGEQLFTVQVRAGNEDVTVVSLAMVFDPEVLQVVFPEDDITGPNNGHGGGHGVTLHPGSPLRQFQVENMVDNDSGTILFTVGDSEPASGTFDFAQIRFRGAGQETPDGDPVEIIFEVGGDELTSVLNGNRQLLMNVESFTGAWVALQGQKPPADAQIDADDDGDEGVPVTFDGSGSLPGEGATNIVDYLWDFDDGSDPVGGPEAVVQHTFGDEGNYLVTLNVEDNNGGRGTESHLIDIRNVAPEILSVDADPRTLPANGGSSTITINATDVPGDIPALLYSFDCDGNSNFGDPGDAANQASDRHDCTFDENDIGSNAVNVQVGDQEGGVTDGSTTVNVGITPDDWVGTLNITGSVPNPGPLSGNPILTFGIRPFCTDLFEFAQKDGGSDQACDVPRNKLLPATELQAYLDNPDGGDPVDEALFDNTLLVVSKFGLPDPDGKVMKWPLLIEIDKPGSSNADVTIEWNIETIPDEFITVLLIDHDTLPAFKVTNIGISANGNYAIPGGISLDGEGKASRNLSVVVTRSLVQTMPLPKDFNIVALTVQPESNLMGDIFKFSGPGSLSLVDDSGAAVFFVQAWDPRADLPIDQRAGTSRTLFAGDSLVPGQGYMVFVVDLVGAPKDHMLIIPGAPLLDTSRGR